MSSAGGTKFLDASLGSKSFVTQRPTIDSIMVATSRFCRLACMSISR